VRHGSASLLSPSLPSPPHSRGGRGGHNGRVLRAVRPRLSRQILRWNSARWVSLSPRQRAISPAALTARSEGELALGKLNWQEARRRLTLLSMRLSPVTPGLLLPRADFIRIQSRLPVTIHQRDQERRRVPRRAYPTATFSSGSSHGETSARRSLEVARSLIAISAR